MCKVYLVLSTYTPNTAPTNRFLSIVEGFSKLGKEAEVVFVLSDTKGSRVEKEWPHIRVTYLWDQLDFRNRYLRQLSYDYLSRQFAKQIQDGDTVILFDPQRMIYSLLKRKGVKIYAERTEHPHVIASRTTNVNKYIRACSKIDGLFVISRALKEFFIREGARQEKVHIINMTVDPSRFIGLERKKTCDRYIAYCGTASNNKDGVDDLIKSFAIVHQRIPDVKLYIIGKGLTENDDSGNMALVNSLRLKEYVVFTGILSAAEMPQVLKNAEVLALARPDSLQAQCGFPTKLGEYLLTENPVVITGVGDIPVFLEDGKTALIAEQRNTEEFANKIIWALEHPEEASVIGKAGAGVAMREFNCVKEAKKIIDVITEKELSR